MGHRVAGQFGVALHLHLFHDASSIGADGFHADMKPVAYLRQGDSGGNHFHHFEFPVREQLMQGLAGGLIQVGDQLLGEAGADVATAVQNFFSGHGQLFGSALFIDIRGRAGAQAAHGVLLLRLATQDDDRHARVGVLDIAQHVHPAAPRHTDIQHQQADGGFPKVAHYLIPVAGFGKLRAGKSLRQDLFQAAADDRVVIRDQDTHTSLLSARGTSTGTRTVTVVPLPGELEICTSPPQNCAGSFMPRSPKDPREFDKFASLKPIPSSSTTRTMFSSSWFRATRTDFACACRATLVRHSWKIRKAAVARSPSKCKSTGGTETWHWIPLREANSLACHSMAAAKPRSSNTPGRSPLHIVLTALTPSLIDWIDSLSRASTSPSDSGR